MSARLSRADLVLLAAWRAGCVSLRYTRTGTLVGLYAAGEADIDADAGKYSTVCEDHGSCVGHESKRSALSHLGHPEEWCDFCRGDYTSAWPRERVEADAREMAEARAIALRAARAELVRQARL